MGCFYKLVLYISKHDLDGKLRKIIPYRIFWFIGYIYNQIIFRPTGYKKLLNKNGNLRGNGEGKRAFVLATGPSIKSENLKLLKNEDCFSVSNFFLHDDINIINPKYHFFIPYHKPLVFENYIEWLKLADKKLPKGTKMVLGHSMKQYIDKYNLFKNREIFYLYFTPFCFNRTNIKYPIRWAYTGPHGLLELLIYMGYSEIYLLGCDHNTLKTYGTERNDFYNRDKDIRKNATDKNARNGIVDFLENQITVFKDYVIFKKIADKKGIKIYNLSEESWLETFEKRKLTDIL